MSSHLNPAGQPEPLDAGFGGSIQVEGRVEEVLEGIGLAHVLTPEGRVYGLHPKTPGIAFGDLREGQRVRCEITRRFHRVLRAEVIA